MDSVFVQQVAAVISHRLFTAVALHLRLESMVNSVTHGIFAAFVLSRTPLQFLKSGIGLSGENVRTSLAPSHWTVESPLIYARLFLKHRIQTSAVTFSSLQFARQTDDRSVPSHTQRPSPTDFLAFKNASSKQWLILSPPAPPDEPPDEPPPVDPPDEPPDEPPPVDPPDEPPPVEPVFGQAVLFLPFVKTHFLGCEFGLTSSHFARILVFFPSHQTLYSFLVTPLALKNFNSPFEMSIIFS